MKFCQYCGKEITDQATLCLSCGCAVEPVDGTVTSQVDESVSGGLLLLAIFIPLFGIIYWPVAAKTRPRCAKACGIAAIVSFVVTAVVLPVFTLIPLIISGAL
ncbi:MAG: hypothetical protein IKM04_00805 [Clostridia bacterium]|nr:hypothetical protein [Clostridia bacterium]